MMRGCFLVCRGIKEHIGSEEVCSTSAGVVMDGSSTVLLHDFSYSELSDG